MEAVCQALIDDYAIPLTAEELALQWGIKYFSFIENLNHHDFQPLNIIERRTLEETIFPLTGRVNIASYILGLDEYLLRPTLFAEVPDVLKQLKLPVCIVSNADDRELLGAIEHLGLRFDYVRLGASGSDTYKAYKNVCEKSACRGDACTTSHTRSKAYIELCLNYPHPVLSVELDLLSY